ncbi:hypothetical protein CRG98_020138 [Punica granatum]|uniref:Alpha/beta hydrolase fold-3 domain-containing protein n=2 Tax=Punica granatum TaxID=22663 RepID=A0A2I0JT63_PUNGR|nr:hypothetical protein CRG98_020138 [Punica granatum]
MLSSIASTYPKPKPCPSSPGLPWMTRIVVSVVSHISDITRRSDGTVKRRLLSFLNLKLLPIPTHILGVSSSDISVDPACDLWFPIFTLSTTTRAAASGALPIIFFPGGGFVLLGAASLFYDAVCCRFAKELDAVIISVNYRLSLEHRFPSQYEDGWEVLRHIDDHDWELLHALSFLAGDSAVGVLVGKGEPGPLAVNVSGPNVMDITDLEEFPATLLFHGRFNSLKDWQKRQHEWLKRSRKEADFSRAVRLPEGLAKAVP